MAEQETIQETIEDKTFEDKFDNVINRLETIYKDVKHSILELKSLKREHNKIVKKATGGKRVKKIKDPDAPKKPASGFAKPTKISKDLCEFLNLNEGDTIARPQVLKKVSEFIKEHKLEDESDGRIIHLDREGGEVLSKLLGIERDVRLTYFNLQTYMKQHFPKDPKKVKEPEPVKESVKEPVKEPEPLVKKVKKRKVVSESVLEHVD